VKPPRFLLGLALALWGSCADVLWLGLLLGALVEGLLAANPRRAFSTADFNRVADLATLLSIGAIGYFAATRGMSEGVLRAVIWFPVMVLPLLLAQIVSEVGHLRLRNLFYSLRKSDLPDADRPIDIAFPYFALCMVSASIAVNTYEMFLPVAALLIAYALFAVRARGRAIWVWALALTIALAIGTATSLGMNRLQLALEDIAFEWLSAVEQDPYRAATRIGDVGRIKLSDEIVWRVRTETRISTELLLFEAAYTFFDGRAWRAPVERFTQLGAPAQGQTWTLGAPAGRLDYIEISGHVNGSGAILALPSGTRSVTGLAANSVARNSLGSVKVADTAPYLKFDVAYAPGVVLQPAPTSADLNVPRSLEPLFDQVRRKLAPSGGSARESVTAVSKFFHDDFRYSLYLGDRRGGKSLSDFLLDSRTGHCEYFATATTLLLRSLGVPARYVVGYSVQEFGPVDELYLVRKRHAHAWTQAYVDGAWVVVDTTPSVWAEAEAQRSGMFTPIYDRISWLWARFSEWRTREGEDTGGWLLGGALLVCVWIYLRLFRRPRAGRAAGPQRAAAEVARESAYFAAESELARAGYPRHPGETPLAWLGRLAADRCPYISDALRALVDAHYQYAYQPDSDRPGLQAEMRELMARWRAETGVRRTARGPAR
jgi:transglutaminase-like putative cysteine protease